MRYWSVPELKKAFGKSIGNTTIFVDCYFGLGLQKSDIDYMPAKLKLLIGLSERLRKISDKVGILKYLTDSVYVKSIKTV